MRIGVVGAGNIAGVLGLLWARAGHVVGFGTRRPEALADLVARCGPGTAAGTPLEAAADGQAVFVSMPYGAWSDLAPLIAAEVAGKLVMDSGNSYPERDGDFARAVLAADEGAGLPVQRLLPGARVARSVNSVYFKTLEAGAHRAGPPGGRIGIPLAGDDPEALARAATLARDAGFEPVVAGPLRRARDFDPGTPVYNIDMNADALARALGVQGGAA